MDAQCWYKMIPRYLSAIGALLGGAAAIVGVVVAIIKSDTIAEKLNELHHVVLKLEDVTNRINIGMAKIRDDIAKMAQVTASDQRMQNPNATAEQIKAVLEQIPTSPLLPQHQRKNEIVASAEFPAELSGKIAIYLPSNKRDELIEKLQKARPSEREEIIKNALEYSPSF